MGFENPTLHGCIHNTLRWRHFSGSALTLSAIVSFLACSAQARELEPLSLSKTEDWDLSYDDDSCDLVGVFGAGEEQVLAKFTRYAPGEGFDLWLFGRKLAHSGQIKSITVDFGPTENPRDVAEFSFGTEEKLQRLWLGSLRLDDQHPSDPDVQPLRIPVEEVEQVKSLTVAIDANVFQLSLDSMAVPMLALNQCVDHLVEGWGYDPREIASASKQVWPRNDPGQWVKYTDFPLRELRKGTDAIVRYRLDIDKQGKPTACHILAATDTPLLNGLSCKLLLKRARFAPALDETGKPVPSFWVNQVTWISL